MKKALFKMLPSIIWAKALEKIKLCYEFDIMILSSPESFWLEVRLFLPALPILVSSEIVETLICFYIMQNNPDLLMHFCFYFLQYKSYTRRLARRFREFIARYRIAYG